MRRREREINSVEEMEETIRNCDVCRIAFADHDTPYIVTMNFGYAGGDEKTLFFHCASEGRKIDMLKRNSYVCFAMDTSHELISGVEACDFSMKYRSIVGWGKLTFVTDDDEKKRGLDMLMRHYSNHRIFRYDVKLLEKTTVLKLVIDTMTGKKLT